MITEALAQSGLVQTVTTPRILFALSMEDREKFLPNRNLEHEFEVETRWIDVSTLSPKRWEQLLFETAPEVLVTGWDTPSIPECFARSSDLGLRYVCHTAGGINALVPRSLLERGVLVTNWGDTINHAVAEHAILLTLGALRNLPLWGRFMQMPSARTCQLRTQSLRGRRVGLHGFGGIAREIVRMLQPFQVVVSAFSAGVPGELFEKHGVRRCETLEDLFSNSDVLIECEALTNATRGSVTAAVLDLLPEDSSFINVGRGAVIDEAALIERAARGKIRVALDVYAQEPPVPNSDFFGIPNALLSPHIAGPTSNTLRSCGDYAVNNLHRYLQGQAVEGVISLEMYDRLA